jgi:hypothetical protein
MKSRSWFVCSLVLLVLVGCKKMPSKPSLTPVRGTVTYKGQPITKGEIAFTPEDLTLYACSSALKEGGAFDMWTPLGGSTSPTGAMPGKYKVSLTGEYGTGKDATKLPKRYEDAGTSGLTVEVKPGGGLVFNPGGDTNLKITSP